MFKKKITSHYFKNPFRDVCISAHGGTKLCPHPGSLLLNKQLLFRFSTWTYGRSPLADAGVEQRRLVAWVGPHEQQQVTLLDAGDAGVQQVVGAQVGAAERAQQLRNWKEQNFTKVLCNNF